MSILYGIKFENDFERLKLGYEQGLVAVKELTEEQFNKLLSTYENQISEDETKAEELGCKIKFLKAKAC